jgi:hypothetical protein
MVGILLCWGDKGQPGERSDPFGPIALLLVSSEAVTRFHRRSGGRHRG